MPQPPLTDLRQGSAQSSGPNQTEMAERRTSMAADRTLMAWIRTALGLFSFGFTLYKLLAGFQAVE